MGFALLLGLSAPRGLGAQTCGFNNPSCGANHAPVITLMPGASIISVPAVTVSVEATDDFKIDSSSFRAYVDGTPISPPFNPILTGIKNQYWSSISMGFSSSGQTHTLMVIVADNQGAADTAVATYTYVAPPAGLTLSLAPHHPSIHLAEPCPGCASTLGYTTPAYVSRDEPQALSLQYSSATAAPMGVVMLDATGTGKTPSRYALKLKRAGTSTYETLSNGTDQVVFAASPGAATRLVGQFDARAFATGMYRYSAEVTVTWTDNTTTSTAAAVPIMIVNERSSPLGVGVSWTGIPRVVPTDSGAMLVMGDGSAIHYTQIGQCGQVNCAHYIPAGTWDVFTRELQSNQGFRLAGRDGSVAIFTLDGYLSRLKNRFGDSTRFVWDTTTHRLTSVVDPAGRTITVTWGAAGTGSLTSIMDGPGGRISTPSYDAYHRLTGMTVAGTAVLSSITYVDSTFHRVQSSTSLLGAVARVHYSAAGWVDSTWVDAGASAARFSRQTTLIGRLLASGAGTSGSPYPGIQPESLWTTATDAEGVVARSLVDRFGAATVAEVLMPNGSVTRTRATRDAYNRTLETMDPRGDKTTNFFTDGLPYPDSVDTPHERSIFTYGKYDQPLSVWISTGYGAMLLSTNALTADSLNIASTTSQGATTTYTWGSSIKSQLLSVTAPNGQTTSYTYQSSGAQNQATVTLPGSLTTTYGYDAIGRRVSTRSPGSRLDSALYDAFNRDTTHRNAGQVVRTQYNDVAHTRTVTVPTNESYVTRMDQYGALISQHDPRNAIDTVLFNATGLDSIHINPLGQVTTTLRDVLGRASLRTAPGETTQFRYDNRTDPSRQGVPTNLWAVDSNYAVRNFYQVDPDGHPVRTYQRLGGSSFEINYTFDGGFAGLRQLRWADSAGTQRMVQWTDYDSYQRPSALRPDTNTRATLLTYTSAGLPDRIKLPIGSGSATLDQQGVFTALGQLASNTFVGSGLNDELGRSYTYYDDGRRASTVKGSSSNITSRFFQYDSIGQLIKYSDWNQILSYEFQCGAYDWDGNCTQYYWQPIWTWNLIRSDSQTYDLAGNIAAGVKGAAYSAHGNQLLTLNNVTMTYDNAGRMLTKAASGGTTWTYTWNGRGQLTYATNGSTWASFEYNAAGLRVRKTTPTSDIRYILSGDQVIAEVNASTGATLRQYQYYPGSDRPHSVRVWTGGSPPSKLYYYVYEEPGNVIALIDTTGAAAQTYQYDPWGNTLDAQGSVVQPFRYAGRELDAETGLYYNRARYYDPQTMRFVSVDPIGLDGGINLYVYVNNDPATLTDPSGLTPCSKALLDAGYVDRVENGETICVMSPVSITGFGYSRGYMTAMLSLLKFNGAKIAELQPEVQQPTWDLLEGLFQKGYVMKIWTAYRSCADQAKRMAKGDSKAVPGNSWHQYGYAVDLVKFAYKGGDKLVQVGDPTIEDQALREIGTSRNFRWGGIWQGQISRRTGKPMDGDFPHFQYLGPDRTMNLETLKKTFGAACQ